MNNLQILVAALTSLFFIPVLSGITGIVGILPILWSLTFLFCFWALVCTITDGMFVRTALPLSYEIEGSFLNRFIKALKGEKDE